MAENLAWQWPGRSTAVGSNSHTVMLLLRNAHCRGESGPGTPKITPSPRAGGIYTTSKTWFAQLTPVHIPNHLDQFCCLAGFTIVTNRQTDHTTMIAAIGCIYAMHAMWPKWPKMCHKIAKMLTWTTITSLEPTILYHDHRNCDLTTCN